MNNLTSMKPGKFLFLLARLFIGGIFVWASIDKILHPLSFSVVVKDYHLLPDILVNLVTVTLPWVELVLGILLIVGLWLPGTVFLANGLLIIFLSALVFNVARGLDVHCGCFSSDTAGSPETMWYIARDVLFVLVGAYLYWRVLREAT